MRDLVPILERQAAEAKERERERERIASEIRETDLAAAREAIARGAPRDAVIQKLRGNGIDPSGL